MQPFDICAGTRKTEVQVSIARNAISEFHAMGLKYRVNRSTISSERFYFFITIGAARKLLKAKGERVTSYGEPIVLA